MTHNLALIYFVGAIVVYEASRFMLRKEPTAHGRAVGMQIGCAVALLWPIAIPYLIVLGSGYAAYFGVMRFLAWRAK